MKLLFCTKCHDVFKLPMKEFKTCECGACKGRYTDNIKSEVSGPCLSLAIGNGSLVNAMRRLVILGNKEDRHKYIEECRLVAWVRPNEGPGNPHSKVIKE